MAGGYLIAGGGTGGHVYPALAVASELRSRGFEVVFAGTRRGIEARVVPDAGFELVLLDVEGLAARSAAARLVSLAKLPLAVLEARALLGRVKPAAVLGVGGYASGPVVIAAWLKRVPILLHEQNVIPGFTNRVALRFARRIAVSFEETARRLGPKAVVTGNPARAEFFALGPPPDSEPLRLLVFGGSQGSLNLNRAVVAALPFLKKHPKPPVIVHQTGERWLDEVRSGYEAHGYVAAVVAYIRDMPRAFADAQLVVSRAGATTVAELEAAGRGAILVPFPHAAGDHQSMNARLMAEAGAAEHLPESELDGGRLAARLRPYLDDPARARELGRRARALARPDAARRIADLLVSVGSGAG